MSSSVEQIKEKLGIAEVVGAYVKIEKAGSNYKARCPFHNEKTPSFFISPSRGSYYCFGCGAKGDIFSFVEQFEGLDFVGALKVLAQKAGVTIEKENPKAKSEKDGLYRALELATEFFEISLKNNAEAKDYITKRGVRENTIKEWRIGFAPDAWRELYEHLQKKGVTTEQVLATGLVKKSENATSADRGYYDMFRGRIMFPIFDSGDRVIGFSGRILPRLDDGKMGKYVNSPETVLFNKSRVLYGLNKAKFDIRKRDYSIMVEGQMDLIMSHQAGFTNTVAVSGTALTTDIKTDDVVTNLGLLTRLSKNIILSFDSDEAGFKASGRNGKTALALGMDVKVTKMPTDEDPADIILRNPSEWAEIVKNSKHIIDYSLETLIERKYDLRKLGKEIQNIVLPYVKSLQSAIDQSHFITKISASTGIKEDALWAELKKIAQTDDQGSRQEITEDPVSKKISRKNNIAKKIIGIIYWLSDKKSKDNVSSAEIEEGLKTILGEEEFNKILKETEVHRAEMIFESELSYEKSNHLDKIVKELLLNFEEEVIDERLSNAMNNLYVKGAKPDEESMSLISKLSKRKQEIKVARQENLTTKDK